jgi:acetyltransferase-like isoleucine patch superfamily enzyme
MIGADSRLAANVAIYPGSRIGEPAVWFIPGR